MLKTFPSERAFFQWIYRHLKLNFKSLNDKRNIPISKLFHPDKPVTHFVDVVLPIAVPNTYTYQVPEKWVATVGFGLRVEVSFGRNKLYSALVVRVHQQQPEYRTKPILSVIDDTPLIYPKHWQFWQWIAEYYCCTPGEVMNAALPTNLKLASQTRIVLSPLFDDDFSTLNDREYMVAEALTIQEELSVGDVRKILGVKSVYHVINRLLEKKIIYLKAELEEKFKPKTIACVRLTAPYASDPKMLEKAFEKLSRANRQVEALVAFIQLAKRREYVRKQDIYKAAGVDSTILRAVERKGIWEIYEREISRFGDFHDDDVEAVSNLSSDQNKAIESLKAHFKNKNVVLLHGVTGSGKTRIYIEMMQAVVSAEEQVLYLLPEIALTTQIISRLEKIFGDQIAVYHSKMTNDERVEIWRAVASGAKPIVLGARSALFLPFKQLKMIVVDEEHDPSFKQHDPAPRYHGRDAAIYLARLFGAKTILGTATPAVETYHNTKTGKYALVELETRFGGVAMPALRIIDAKKDMKQRRKQAHFTLALIDALKESLERKEQAILFQNRRGFAPILRCETCQWRQECVHCDVSLTYHKFQNNLQCHYCGFSTAIPKHCPACGSAELKMQGFGTEKIEDELSIYLPDAKTGRMDLDTVRTKNAHIKIINDFEEGRIDVLVGTQMVTKGLDFENVGLVGVVSADQLLQFPDFRAGERAFQLIAQVAGRAGRKNKQGRVLIQAMNVAHPVLKEVLDHDYKAFYAREIMERQSFHYPPFTRLIRITLKHKKPQVLNDGARVFDKYLRPYLQDQLKGPAVPYIGRIRGQYLLDFLIKLAPDSGLLRRTKKYIGEATRHLHKVSGYSTIRVNVDVDPY